MRIIGQEKPALAELVHYGVKGMKWGVRKAYSDRKSGTAASYRKVASGTASAREKTRAFLMTSPNTVQRQGGFKKAAASKATRLQQHADRIRNGQATTKDILEMIGTLSVNDIGMGIYNARQKK